MKITGSGQNLANIDSLQQKKNEKAGGLASAINAKKGDALSSSSQVDISDKAQSIQKAKAIASEESVDEAKIARLQALIDAGEYKVDAQSIADRLVDEHIIMS